MNVAETKEEIPHITAKEEPPEAKESLLLKRIFLKSAKEVEVLAQWKNLFRTICMSKGKCFKLVIDSGSTDNLVYTEMVENLKLEKTVEKGHQIIVTEQCKVEI